MTRIADPSDALVEETRRPLRIAILGTRGIPAHYGGYETVAEELATRFARAGVDVTVYCPKANADAPVAYRDVRLEYVPEILAGPFSNLVYDVRSLWHARRSFDIVYMLGYASAAACLLPRFFGTSMWINPDGLEWARSKWSWPARAYLKTMEMISSGVATRIIADAVAIEDHFKSRYRLSRNKTATIPYGAPRIESGAATLLEKLGLTPYQFYLVVARMEPENHVNEMVQGYETSAVRRPLALVGSLTANPTYGERLRTVKARGLKWLGGIYDRALLQTLRFYARAYLHGHSVGGTNPSLVEAMGAGRPIVAHDNPFNREVAGSDAFYFSTVEEAAAVLRKVDEMDEPGLTALGNRLRARRDATYTWQRVTDSYLRLLNKEALSRGLQAIPENQRDLGA